MLSIWQKQSFYFHTDVLIIGGGLTGLITAIYLKQKQPHLKVRVLEKGLYPSGASAKNAGFACYGSVSEILDDISSEGEDKAITRVENRFLGLQKLLKLTSSQDIGLENNGGRELFTLQEKEMQEECFDELSHVNQLVSPILGANGFTIVQDTTGMKVLDKQIFTAKESALHSGKLLRALLKTARELDVELNFSCEVIHYNKSSSSWTVSTKNGDFTCDKLVLATNGFTKQFEKLDIQPGRGQLILTEPIKGFDWNGNFHLHQGYFYFRNLQGRLLIGGGRHLDKDNENTTSQNTSDFIQGKLENLIDEYLLPGLKPKIEMRWAGTMAFGPNNEKETIVNHQGNGLFIGARFGGMGVALSSYEADKLSNLIINS